MFGEELFAAQGDNSEFISGFTLVEMGLRLKHGRFRGKMFSQ